MNGAEAAQWLKAQITPIYGDGGESESIAAMVLEEITGIQNKRDRKNFNLTPERVTRLATIAQRLQLHEPIQYILEYAWFAGLKLYVNSSVLIPRSETEELVHWVKEDVRAAHPLVFHEQAGRSDSNSLRILDVGSGSGCIALALKAMMPGAEVWGCDLSEEALNIARRNGSHNNIRVDFQGVDFLDTAQYALLPAVDIIVSNPPYIPLRDQATIAPHVIQFEPHRALFVPDHDPLVFYQHLARFGREKMHDGGSIYVEIEENSSAGVLQIFSDAGYREVVIKKDMQGKDRMVKASNRSR